MFCIRRTCALSLALGSIVWAGCPDMPTPARDADPGEDAPTPRDASISRDGGPDAPATPPVCTGDVLHVATTGDDASGDGSEARPFRTLAHATATVTTAGSTIRLAAGTYDETEVADLAPGVCLTGAGEATVIRSSITALFTPMLRLRAPAEGTPGEQSISQLTFDGRLTTQWAIEIRGRTDVAVHDCTFRDLFDSAVVWGGRIDTVDDAPTTYATGNTFHHNTVLNSAHCADYCRGALFFGGQDGFEIHDNFISTLGRAPGTAGWPLKGQVNEGYNRRLSIHHNTLIASADAPFDFAIELFRVSGAEVFENDITGSVDANFQGPSEGIDFGLRVHHNRIHRDAPIPAINNAGVVLEFASDAVEVYENRITNVMICFHFTPRDQHVEDVRIHHNLCEGVALEGLRIQDNALSPDQLYSGARIRIEHNTILGASGGYGIALRAGTGTSDVDVTNNVLAGFQFSALTIGDTGPFTGLRIRNNTTFDVPRTWFIGAEGTTPPPAGTIEEGTLTSDPLLVGDDLHPDVGSPAIDSGIDIGDPFLGTAPDRGWIEVR